MEPTFAVYANHEVSRCVPTDAHGERARLEAEGMSLFLEATATKIEGWALAATELSVIPDDYDDSMTPVACFEKRVLYRSVSPEELEDILLSGAVVGGGNGFNDFDRRPFVFFSPAPTENCIWQGEEVERAASVQVIREAGGPAAFEGPGGRDRFLALYRGRLSELRQARKEAEFTSAVIRTLPIGPSLHYSVEHGRTGMGGEDEYGLFPGQVKLEDVAEVMLVRNGKAFRRLEAGDFASLRPQIAPTP